MEPFKNVFSPALVDTVAGHLARRLPEFDRKAFEKSILPRLDALELKDRAQLIADAVHAALPLDGGARAAILADMLHPDASNETGVKSDERGLRGWAVLPLSLVVGQNGLTDFDRSLGLLREMTCRFTAEFAIRYFMLADQARTLRTLTDWVHDPSVNVRRLVSEGTRPRLPWAMQLPALIADPSPTLPLLEALRDDKEEYVRRSVANHLNDIAKDHPDLVADLAGTWIGDAGEDRRRLLRHACRSLIKQGHERTLDVFGLGQPLIAPVEIGIATPDVRFGETLDFTVEIRSVSDKTQPLLVDYVMHFLKANRTRAAKVFKWTRFDLAPGESRVIARRHPIRPITTRRYYPGTQAISLRINGRDHGMCEFDLTMDSDDACAGN